MARETIIVTAGSFSTTNTFGGHFRSASDVAQILGHHYEVLLVNVGTRPSPLMKTPGKETLFIKGHTVFPTQARRQIAELMHAYKIKAVVAFDQKVGELFRPLVSRLGLGFVLVKPGGGRPRLYYPKASHQVAFTETDRAWIENTNYPKKVNVGFAPGRIFKPPQDLEAQAELRAHIGLTEDEITLVRIGRIDEHYSTVNRSAIRLSQLLRKMGIPARLIMIGAPQSAAEVAALQRMKSETDVIVTDERFTYNASKLLSMFRFNIGTGRGFMEGSAMGQVMFCATNAKDYPLPLLATEDNLHQLLAENFSPRVKPDITPKENLAQIQALFANRARQDALGMAARNWCEKYFSAASSLRIYHDIIEAASAHPERHSADFLLSEAHLRFSVLIDRIRRGLT